MQRSPKEVISALVENQELVFYFFAVFSRFEYALKRSGFLKQKRAEADWEAYTKSLGHRFATVAAPAFREACAYLKEEPPKKQVIDGGALCWKDTVQGKGESGESYILSLVRRVRNNLFHGGKYSFRPVLNGARNRRLIESCAAVLEECLRLSPDVWRAFEGAAQRTRLRSGPEGLICKSWLD